MPGQSSCDDGTLVPMWHDSEVALLAHAIQNTPTRHAADPVQQQLLTSSRHRPWPCPGPWRGKKCSECGAHVVNVRNGRLHYRNAWHPELVITVSPVRIGLPGYTVGH